MSKARIESVLPAHRDLYYDGKWQAPAGGYTDTLNPGTGESLGRCAEASAADVDAVLAVLPDAVARARRARGAA